MRSLTISLSAATLLCAALLPHPGAAAAPAKQGGDVARLIDIGARLAARAEACGAAAPLLDRDRDLLLRIDLPIEHDLGFNYSAAGLKTLFAGLEVAEKHLMPQPLDCSVQWLAALEDMLRLPPGACGRFAMDQR